MSWRHVQGHDENAAALRQAVAEGRLPHALLFVGPEGIGKRLFAKTLAQALLCERSPETAFDPCGVCPGCSQVMAGTHPDVLMIAKPEDKHELPISTIRDLCIDLGLKPMRGTRRVAIVDDADDFSEEAANAFLKTLEEPPFGSVLILLGTSAELQLDTVLSRCRVMRFKPLDDATLATVIQESHLVDNPEDAARIAALAEGSVGRAQGLAMPDFAAFRRALLDDVAEQRGFDPSALARRVEAFSKEAGKESAAQRARAGLLIAELTRLFRGVLWQTAGLEPPTADAADRRAMHALAQRLEPEHVFVLADRCMEANYHLLRRVNLGFLLEALFHDLAAIVRR
jgi:DNA polymerase-3 subunit delta'